MPVITIDPSIITLAHDMADSAGAILRRAFRQPFTMNAKSDSSPVTAIDREVEQAMRALIETRTPDYGIVGEEFGNVRSSSPWQWVLDPIDGTRSFIAGYPLFTTLIALAYEGVPLLGIIDQAILQERWVGNSHSTSFTGGDKLTKQLDSRQRGNDISRAVICTTSAPYYYNVEENAAFDRVRAKCAQTIIGGDGYGYAMLASGQIDIFMDTCLKPYDFCALKPVIEGAGGVITDWNGAPLTLSSDGKMLAAATAPLHAEALSLIKR